MIPIFIGMTDQSLAIKFLTMKQFCVYILPSGRNGTLYIGLTSDLVKRVWEHKNKVTPGFTAKYGCDQLVHFEVFDNAEAAITREKQIKELRRAWKIALIEKSNPAWRDRYADISTGMTIKTINSRFATFPDSLIANTKFP